MPELAPVWMMILAPFAGSFLGVLVRRLPAGRPVVVGRSACEACGRALAARDMVPLLSYAWLRGRCRWCGAAIGAFHPAIEVASVAVAGLAWGVDGGDPARMVAGCVLGWALLALGWIDAVHLRLPDVLTLPLVLLGLGATAWLEPDALAEHAAASAVGYVAFAGVGALYRWRRHREGLGLGDAKLMAAAGAWVGLAGLAPVMLGGALLGLAVVLTQRMRGRMVVRETAVPFGPCLAGALFGVWLAG